MDELLWLLCLSELVHLRKALQTGGVSLGVRIHRMWLLSEVLLSGALENADEH